MTDRERYYANHPSREDEFMTWGVDDFLFHNDGSVDWDSIDILPEDVYDELQTMGVLNELAKIDSALEPERVNDILSGLREDENSLAHYGMPRRSGRYPWGSGDSPYQHSGDFLNRVYELRKQGVPDTEIYKAVGLNSTTELRAYMSVAVNERRANDIATVEAMKKAGKTTAEIARAMNRNESSIRSLLNEGSKARTNQAMDTAEFIKKQIQERGMVDLGGGVERELGISKEKLNEAIAILEADGYPVYPIGMPQVTNPGKQTNMRVACAPGTAHKDVYANRDDITSLMEYRVHADDEGHDIFKPSFVFPAGMDASRVMVRYPKDGGADLDGTIYLRPGVKDLDLGESNYAQVRIMVNHGNGPDDALYAKGMAYYADPSQFPPGVDMIFNTSKPDGAPLEKVLKPVKKDRDGHVDKDNPFGSLIKEDGGQSYYTDDNGEIKLSLINKRAEEGDWGEWGKHLPSQMLSKQNIALISEQLGKTEKQFQQEYDDICALTNPTVKKTLLESFANDCDKTAESLQCAGFKDQKWQVILPINSLSDKECYAPNYPDGTTLALIRYPHGGTFEIPIVTVNNGNKEARDILGANPKDAIGINASVAARLSGADFDGDTVMAIPCNEEGKPHITSKPPLKDLEGFDPKMSYPEVPGMTYMKHDIVDRKTGKVRTIDNTQKQMGIISNLITDMTLQGATDAELARAVKHSMVVIDAGKHKLDYKRSERENGIAALKRKYQGHINEEGRYAEGAATIISRAKGEQQVLKRTGNPWINRETGEKEWTRINPKTGEVETKYVEEHYIDPKTGKDAKRMMKSTKMAETKDAHTLSSGTPKEELYADYANWMKAMANQARKEIFDTPRLKQDKHAKEEYRAEYDALMAKLNIAEKNSPRERLAQAAANAEVHAKELAYDDLTKKEKKKIGQQALMKYRQIYGAKKEKINITEREWEAIQAGAISENQLSLILKNADLDQVRKYATPKATTAIPAAKQRRIRTLVESGKYTNAQIAEELGVSVATVQEYGL